MPIELSAESERMVEEEIASGRFQSLDEIIQQGILARSEDPASDRSKKHLESIERTLEFIRNPILLEGISFQELLEEGRQL
jgi:Arc/MetJ-type ribon-helix-helix transcriptional regulator